MKITAYTTVENQGWTANAFEVETKLKASDVSPSDFTIGLEQWGTYHENASKVTQIEEAPNGLRLTIEPFGYGKFRLTGSGAGAALSFDRDSVTTVITEGADEFEARNDNGVLYRLYSPTAAGPRPLVLYLHGGGECGTDNQVQLTGTLGAVRIAGDYPDVYVMAPQAPSGLIPIGGGKVVMPSSFATSDIKGAHGWHRQYLANICDIIRSMISEGKVDPARVYVTGLSMGGGGTLRALSVGSGLFAAAAPICPTMTPETFGILCSLVDTKIWISTAYVDHTIYRHKYIVDGILKLRDLGNNNARLTLYSPEELAAYGLSTDPDMPLERKFSSNHASWILTYNNEHGIMDWLMSQVKG